MGSVAIVVGVYGSGVDPEGGVAVISKGLADPPPVRNEVLLEIGMEPVDPRVDHDAVDV